MFTAPGETFDPGIWDACSCMLFMRQITIAAKESRDLCRTLLLHFYRGQARAQKQIASSCLHCPLQAAL